MYVELGSGLSVTAMNSGKGVGNNRHNQLHQLKALRCTPVSATLQSIANATRANSSKCVQSCRPKKRRVASHCCENTIVSLTRRSP